MPRADAGTHAEVYRFDLYELDAGRRQLCRDSLPLNVEPKLLEVLAELLHNAGELVTKNELIDTVWAGRVVTESVVTRCISKLRSLLGDDAQTLILTVHGYGYRFTGEVRRVAVPVAEALPGPVLASGYRPPSRPHWQLLRPLAEAAGVWLAGHDKTGERRVFKFGLAPARLPALKRELTVQRLLARSLGPRDDYARLLDYNLDTPPCFLELEYCADGSLPDWLAAQGGIEAVSRTVLLELLAQAAETLAAAHAVGVLHLDVKPANLLIWHGPDARPRIRWSDFGCARLLEPGRLAELGITRTGGAALGDSSSGTPLYLAPEVIGGETPTALADIYALGVMLYQVVVGDLRRPLAAGWELDVDDELLREDIAAAAEGHPARRLASARELAQRLRTLETRRSARRRAHALEERAAALQRVADRTRARRPLLIAAGVFLAAGLSLSLWSYRNAAIARDLARHKADTAEAVTAFLNDVIAAGSPYAANGNSHALTVREALAQASAGVDEKFSKHPETAAAVHGTLALLYNQYGELDAAELHARRAAELNRRAFGAQATETLRAEMLLGFDLVQDSRLSEAGEVIASLNRETAPPNRVDPDLGFRILALRGAYYDALERYDLAAAQSERAIAALMTSDAGHTSLRSRYRITLALRYVRLGRFAESQRLFDEALADLRKAYGADSSLTRVEEVKYAVALTLQRRYDEAEPLLRRLVAALPASVGAADRSLGEAQQYLGQVCLKTGRTAEAAQFSRSAFETFRTRYGADNLATRKAQGDAGIAAFEAGERSAGLDNLRAAETALAVQLGQGAPSVQWFRYQRIRASLRANLPAAELKPLAAQLDPEALRAAAPAEDWPSMLAMLRGEVLLAEGNKREATQVMSVAFENLRKASADEVDLAAARRSLRAAHE